MRNDLIIAINNIFDENVNLRVRNEYLERYYEENEKSKTCCAKENKKISELDLKTIDFGKKQLTDKVISTWRNEVNVSRDEKNNSLVITSYDEWLDEKICESEIPENMSKTEVKNIIYDYANQLYEKEKVKAIKYFEEEELEKKGSESDE